MLKNEYLALVSSNQTKAKLGVETYVCNAHPWESKAEQGVHKHSLLHVEFKASLALRSRGIQEDPLG